LSGLIAGPNGQLSFELMDGIDMILPDSAQERSQSLIDDPMFLQRLLEIFF
jgi:hypothetical protein